MIPYHVGIIPDGNRRWARSKGLSVAQGHTQGYLNMLKIARHAKKLGIKVITFWGFSTENWNREKKEVRHLMNLAIAFIQDYEKDLMKDKMRIVHLGRKDRLGDTLKNKISKIEEETKDFHTFCVAFAFDYGGQDEIIRAFTGLKKTIHKDTSVSPSNLSSFLDTSRLPYPNPDLIIRTGGEQRLSGFMLWQSAYAELIFMKKFFPDFSPTDLTRCLKIFETRQRRFGK